MSADDVPFFEVTSAPITDEQQRWLTTAAAVRAVIDSPASADSLIETIIGGVSADCVGYCGLANAGRGLIPTFAFEDLRANWLATGCERGTRLWLPWRVPVTEIVSIVENGTTLAEGTDFRLVDEVALERLSGDSLASWSTGKIVVEYGAGWDLPDGVPENLVAQVIEQVKLRYLQRAQNPGLRSMSTEGVGSASFSVPGGDSISQDGLLAPLEAALTPFRSWAMA